MSKGKITVLTTSPSININQNVSGISSITNLWIKNNSQINYILFISGKKDKTTYGVFWLLTQPITLFRFIFQIVSKKIDIVHINMPLENLAVIREFFFIIISKIFQKRIILHIHGGKYNMNKQIPNLISSLIKQSLRISTKIIVLGEKECHFLMSEYHILKEKTLVLPNGVKIPKKKLTIKDPTKVLKLLFLGRLDRNKGLNEIINSLKELSSEINYMFEIAGDGPDKDWFLTKCETNLPNNYNYNGVVFGIQKEQLLSKCHVFLLPSYFEGLPSALLEAMSYGQVPIVTPVGSIQDVILNNKNGIIIPIKNSTKIIDGLNKISTDSLFYDKLSKKAYQTIQEKFSLSNYLISLNKIYNDLIIKSI